MPCASSVACSCTTLPKPPNFKALSLHLANSTVSFRIMQDFITSIMTAISCLFLPFWVPYLHLPLQLKIKRKNIHSNFNSFSVLQGTCIPLKIWVYKTTQKPINPSTIWVGSDTMPRIVIRVKKQQPVSNPPADFPAADAGCDAVDGPSSASSPPKPQNTPNPSPKQLKDKETINCILNTHVTHLSTDSENTNDSGSCDAVDMLPLLQRKRPRKKPPSKTASGHAMPPLSPSAAGGRGGSRGSKISPVPNRNLDDTNMDDSGGSPSSKYNDGVNRPILRSMVKKRSYSESLKIDSNWFIDPQAMGGSVAAAGAEYQSMGGINEKMQWPKIQIELSRKEKEEDFFSMDGIKLPLRPKRRAKPVEKAVQNCYPGMSLEDVTKARYEVRGERKNAKKKRRGLRGMITDSD